MTKLDDLWHLVTNLREIGAILLAMNLLEWTMMTLGGALLLVAIIKRTPDKGEPDGVVKVESPFLKISLNGGLRIGLVIAGILLIFGSILEHIEITPIEGEKNSTQDSESMEIIQERIESMSDEEREAFFREKSWQ